MQRLLKLCENAAAPRHSAIIRALAALLPVVLDSAGIYLPAE